MSAERKPVETLADAHRSRAQYMREHLTASARKSLGSYKPIIVHDRGSLTERTEVVGTCAETRYREWIDGRPNPRTAYTHYERGRTFSDRGEAVQYAQQVIDSRIANAASMADRADVCTRHRAAARQEQGAASHG